MPPNRRNLLASIGGLIIGGGALVGAGALDAFSTQQTADMRVVTEGALVELDVGPDATQDEVVTRDGTLAVDFARASGSGGVQPDATYQLGGIDVDGNPQVSQPLRDDSVVSDSGYPSPTGGGTAQDDAAIIVRNNSSELLGVTADFTPGTDFPGDGRLFVVMHDTGQGVGGTDVRAELYGPNGVVRTSSTSAEYRPVYSGEELGVSVWLFTGTEPTADLSGVLTFSGNDADDVPVGDT